MKIAVIFYLVLGTDLYCSLIFVLLNVDCFSDIVSCEPWIQIHKSYCKFPRDSRHRTILTGKKKQVSSKI